MNLEEYKSLCLVTANNSSEIPPILNWLLGLSGESGEVCDLLKKHIFHNHELNTEKLISELGDCLYYISMISHEYNIDLNEVLEYNVNKLRKRYPNGFSSQDSINRVN